MYRRRYGRRTLRAAVVHLWYKNGELYTRLTSFAYTVTDEYGQNFEARFTFNPDSPDDPGSPSMRRHEFYIMNKVTKPGAQLKFPVYLPGISPLTDASTS